MDGAYSPRNVDYVFGEFQGRRIAIIRALTSDVDEFFRQCDPDKENLCLYGHPSGKWEVNLPAEEVPAELPEPMLGINFARDGMQASDWLALVAVHSDAWLLAVSFYYGARFSFDKTGRKRLFDMINELPTIYEVVSRENNTRTSTTSHSSNKPKSNSKMQRASEAQAKYSMGMQQNKEDELSDEEEEEHGETQCGACRQNYAAGEFWICCDICEIWFHGQCVKITPARAEHIKQYKCPSCSNNKRGQHPF